jgi:hypothetical protein
MPLRKSAYGVTLDRPGGAFLVAIASRLSKLLPLLILNAGLASAAVPAHVQLADMIAPAVHPDGRRATTTITFFLGIARPADVEVVCRRYPIVRDAILVAVNRQPVPAFGRHLDAASAAPGLLKAVNAALGAPLVVAVDMIPGVPREAPRGVVDSGAASPRGSFAGGDPRTTGSAAGCRGIAALPAEVEGQARAVAAVRAQFAALAPPAAQARDQASPSQASAETGQSLMPSMPASPGHVVLLLVTAGAAAVVLGAGVLIGHLLSRRRKAGRRRRERRLAERRFIPGSGYAGVERRAPQDRRADQERRRLPERRGR